FRPRRERSKLVTRMRVWMAGDLEQAPRYPNLRAHPFNYPSRPSRSPLSVGELPSLGVLSHPRKRQESPCLDLHRGASRAVYVIRQPIGALYGPSFSTFSHVFAPIFCRAKDLHPMNFRLRT